MLSNIEEIKRDMIHTQSAIVGMESVMNILEKDVRETDIVIDNLNTISSTIAMLMQNYHNKKLELINELMRTAETHIQVEQEVNEIESEIKQLALMAYDVDDEEGADYSGTFS